MAQSLGCVAGAHHGPEQLHFQYCLIRVAFNLIHHGVEFLPGGQGAGFDAVCLEFLGQLAELGGVGSFMHAVDGGQGLGIQCVGHGLVRNEHELLHKLVGFVPGFHLHIHRGALVICDEPDFRHIQPQGTGLEAFAAQQGGQLTRFVNHGIDLCITGRRFPLQYLQHLRVCKPPPGADDRVPEVSLEYFALAVNLHEAQAGEAVFALAQ